MPRESRDYICPRCFYATNIKYRITRHFRELKAPCPNRGNIEITDDIVDEVIKNHIYYPKLEKTIESKEPPKPRKQSKSFQCVSVTVPTNRYIANQIIPTTLKNGVTSKDRCNDPSITGYIYVYGLVPKFENIIETLTYFREKGIRIPDLNKSPVLCKDDCLDKILVKVGKAEYSAVGRQCDYLSDLSNIYEVIEGSLISFTIDFPAKLSEIETCIISKIKMDKLALVDSKSQVYNPKEVVFTNSLIDTQNTVEEIVQQFKQFYFENSCNYIKLVELEKELAALKDVEEKSKAQQETIKDQIDKLKGEIFQTSRQETVSLSE